MRLSPEQIDEMFTALSVYAPLRKESGEEEARVVSLTDYFEQMKADFAAGLEENRKAEKKRLGVKIGGIIGAALIVCALVIIAASLVTAQAKKKISEAEIAQKNAEAMQESAEKSLADFAKKFKQVEPMNGGDVQLEDDFLEVFDLSMEKSEDLKDTFLFSCKLKVNGKQHGLYMHRNTAIIVQMKDGTVAEYVLSTVLGRLFDVHVGPFQPWYSNIAELPEIQIFTDSADNIAYIKLTNLMVCSSENLSKDLIPGIEFELYKAE